MEEQSQSYNPNPSWLTSTPKKERKREASDLPDGWLKKPRLAKARRLLSQTFDGKDTEKQKGDNNDSLKVETNSIPFPNPIDWKTPREIKQSKDKQFRLAVYDTGLTLQRRFRKGMFITYDTLPSVIKRLQLALEDPEEKFIEIYPWLHIERKGRKLSIVKRKFNCPETTTVDFYDCDGEELVQLLQLCEFNCECDSDTETVDWNQSQPF